MEVSVGQARRSAKEGGGSYLHGAAGLSASRFLSSDKKKGTRWRWARALQAHGDDGTVDLAGATVGGVVDAAPFTPHKRIGKGFSARSQRNRSSIDLGFAVQKLKHVSGYGGHLFDQRGAACFMRLEAFVRGIEGRSQEADGGGDQPRRPPIGGWDRYPSAPTR